MHDRRLIELTAAEVSAAVAAGDVAPADVLQACSDEVTGTDAAIAAWVAFDIEVARDGAKHTRHGQRRRQRVLEGVPIGVKDVLAVEGFATVAGFAPFRDCVAKTDSTVVSRLRSAGAIIVGKTATAQFAYRDPPATRNPWNVDRTPGGSSSGSAAAVAARHVPMAIATQTGGSILRPAAYTGVDGFKPSFGLVPTRGLVPLAPSLDHVGVIARSVADCRLFLRAAKPRTALNIASDASRNPKLLIGWDALRQCTPEVRHNFVRAVETLRAAGADLRDAEPLRLDVMLAAHRIIMQAEATALHDRQLETHGFSYRPLIRAFIESGRSVPASGYVQALCLAETLRHDLTLELAPYDALLLPSVPDEPPAIETTGDASLLSPFSLAGTPTITLPSGVTKSQLPLGIQLVGHPGRDDALLSTAEWCEDHLGRGLPPPRIGESRRQ